LWRNPFLAGSECQTLLLPPQGSLKTHQLSLGWREIDRVALGSWPFKSRTQPGLQDAYAPGSGSTSNLGWRIRCGYSLR
jgi:hypothetical protein